ncbi:unnamed protein product [Rotaria sp. Silwood2]|nr:unnamed protein product [Rotaria sp. Silwood2]CAF3951645.1 unnamed protein product [Rotaria sp. Silwood2]
MGGGGSKKAKGKAAQQEPLNQPTGSNIQQENKSEVKNASPASSPSPTKANSASPSPTKVKSASSPVPSPTKANNNNEFDGHDSRTSHDELNNNNFPIDIDRTPSPIDTPVEQSKSPVSRRSLNANSAQSNNSHRKGSRSSKLDTHSDGKISVASIHQHSGTCRYCPHCRKMADGKIPPTPGWIIKNPGIGQLIIKMDKYDLEAVREKITTENGHYPGCYDYRPYLTIEEDNDKDDRKETDYYTQSFITRKKSSILTSHTPYPDYNNLQRREQRLNKPYETTLFVD